LFALGLEGIMSDAIEKKTYETPRVEQISTSLDTEKAQMSVVESGSCFPMMPS
jgi:hypothetical protein